MKAEKRQPRDSNYGGLTIDEDLGFARREWKVQRGGWVVLGLLILAGAAGLLGKGFLGRATLAGPGARLEYDRLERFQRPTQMRLRFEPTAPPSAGIFISQGYLDAIRVERIEPPPEKTEASHGGVVFYFANAARSLDVTFHLQFERFGRVQGEIGPAGQPPLSFQQFVYP